MFLCWRLALRPIDGGARSYVLERCVSELAAVGPVDGVLLNLHGAMVAEDDDNPELARSSGPSAMS